MKKKNPTNVMKTYQLEFELVGRNLFTQNIKKNKSVY